MKPRRMLPPVGHRVPIGTVLSSAALAALTRDAETDLTRALQRDYEVAGAFGISSGKAALTVILRALRRQSARTKVVIPAYTCYSVPSAVVKAGLEVVPCDIAAGTFDYDYDELVPKLDRDVLCVLSVHLFGIPADTMRLRDLCRGTGIVVVEDAAQAMGGSAEARPLGTMGDVGFFSLGRGKNLTSGSGGIVIARDAGIAAAVSDEMSKVSSSRPLDDLASVCVLVAMSILLSPALYWFPAGLPFLRLGETIFHDDFPIRRLSRFQALLLKDRARRLDALDAVRRSHTTYYATHVATAARELAGRACLRFPILMPDAGQKSRLLGEMDGEAIGISGMYPASVGAIPQLQGHLAETRFPCAEQVAATLVTLPTHTLVTLRDRARICDVVNRALRTESGASAASSHEVAHLSEGL